SLVSVNAQGTSSGNKSSGADAISADGQTVLFASSADDLISIGGNISSGQVFVRHVGTGVTALVTVDQSGTAYGNLESEADAMSPDGRWVLFDGEASNLVEGDWNLAPDSFARDLTQNETFLVSQVNQVQSVRTGNRGGYGAFFRPDANTVIFS